MDMNLFNILEYDKIMSVLIIEYTHYWLLLTKIKHIKEWHYEDFNCWWWDCWIEFSWLT